MTSSIEKMSIKKALKRSNLVDHSEKGASVLIKFVSKTGQQDETEFDLYSDHKWAELEELWSSMYNEMGAEENSILCIEDRGFLN